MLVHTCVNTITTFSFFQKTLLAVPLLDCSTTHRASPVLSRRRCVHVRAHMRVYSCIVLISRCQQRLAVGLDWYTADTPVTLRYERYGLAKTVPINYTRKVGACACSHVRVCVFIYIYIYRQIKRGRTMCYWKYAYTRGHSPKSRAYACVRMCLRQTICERWKMYGHVYVYAST